MAVEEKEDSKMQRELVNALGAIFFVLSGLGLVVFHRRMASFAVMMWRKQCRMNPPNEIGYRILFLLGGCVFLIFGLLTLFGIFK